MRSISSLFFSLSSSSFNSSVLSLQYPGPMSVLDSFKVSLTGAWSDLYLGIILQSVVRIKIDSDTNK